MRLLKLIVRLREVFSYNYQYKSKLWVIFWGDFFSGGGVWSSVIPNCSGWWNCFTQYNEQLKLVNMNISVDKLWHPAMSLQQPFQNSLGDTKWAFVEVLERIDALLLSFYINLFTSTPVWNAVLHKFKIRDIFRLRPRLVLCSNLGNLVFR